MVRCRGSCLPVCRFFRPGTASLASHRHPSPHFQEHIRHITGDVLENQRQALLQILRQPARRRPFLLPGAVLLEQQQELRAFSFSPMTFSRASFGADTYNRRRHLVRTGPGTRSLLPSW